ncbi:MAG: hypothetical protein MJZ74_05670 [Muribaculaceae bacterium]|nr:hypothetical protein [Muribaculaceae bacterium]
MKRFLFISLTALALNACTLSSGDGSQADTAPNVAQADYDAPKYLSKDLAMQDLGGQVKSMALTEYDGDQDGNIVKDSEMDDVEATQYFDFDANGTMTRGFAFGTEDKGVTFVRNAAGEIERTEANFADIGFTKVNTYTYNEDGTVATLKISGYEFEGTYNYTYKDGTLTAASITEAGEGTVYNISNTYKIMETDGHGNWTKRFSTNEVKSMPDDGSGNIQGTETIYRIEVRNIEYYK